MNIDDRYLQTALQQYPVLAAHPYIAEAVTLLGADNHTSTCYYAATEYYLTAHAAKFDPAKLNELCRLAYANDDLDLLVAGEHSAVQKVINSNDAYKALDHFLDTVFGETDDSDYIEPELTP